MERRNFSHNKAPPPLIKNIDWGGISLKRIKSWYKNYLAGSSVMLSICLITLFIVVTWGIMIVLPIVIFSNGYYMMGLFYLLFIDIPLLGYVFKKTD